MAQSDYVYMKISRDKYELPLAVADTATELARLCGLKPESVMTYMSRVRSGHWKRSQYIKVDVSGV